MQYMQGHFKNVLTLHTANLFPKFFLKQVGRKAYLGLVQVHTVHGEFLGIFKEQHVGLGRTHCPGENKNLFRVLLEMSQQCQGRVKLS